MKRESVLDRVRARDVLRAAGVNVPEENPGKLIRCPLPGHDDSTPSFRVFDRGFVCFGGCGKGGILDLVVALGLARTRSDAAKLLEVRFR